MAKQRDTERPAETSPNAPQAGDAPASWSVEDMQRLDQQQTELATIVSAATAKLDALETRFATQEMLLSKLDLGEGILPAEIASGVSLSAIYVGALQASLMAIAAANPLGLTKDASRNANIRLAFDTAEGFLNEAIRRSALRQKA